MGKNDQTAALTAKGVNGQITIEGGWLTIHRKGVLAKSTAGLTKGDKRIAIRSITAVQLKMPGLTNGYIQFTVPGGNESSRGVMDATKDENSVVFSRFHRDEFVAVKDYIEAAVDTVRIAEETQPSSSSTAATAPSLADQLRDLGKLRDEGLLSDAEFEAQKARLLGS